MTDSIKKVDATVVAPAKPAGDASKTDASKVNSVMTATPTYNGVNPMTFLNGGMGYNINPSWCLSNPLTEAYLPQVTAMFSIPQFSPQFSFGGMIQDMFKSFHKIFLAQSGAQTPAATDPAAAQTPAAAKAPATTDPAAAKTPAAADPAAAPAAETKANEKTTKEEKSAKHKKHSGNGHTDVVVAERNPHDYKFAGTKNRNHIYTDPQGNRVCKRYVDGKLYDTITFKDGVQVSIVKAGSEAANTKPQAAAQPDKKATAEASKICSQLYVAMKGMGTDSKQLTENVNKINSGNVVEVMDEWKKRYSSRMGNESLVQSIDNDIYGAQSYTKHLKEALSERATKMGLTEDAQAFEAVVNSENRSWYTNDSTVEGAFDDMLEQIKKAQKAN